MSEIASDLALVMRPRSKFDRVVSTEVLVEAGLSVIEKMIRPNGSDPEARCRGPGLRRGRRRPEPNDDDEDSA
jgi:hypothetical protein